MRLLGSFRQRIFLALMAVALVPAAVAVGAGMLTLREIGSTTGTLGPWDAVAASGRELIDAATSAAPDDSVVLTAATAHGEALSESVRWSRLWSFVTGRIVAVLPLLALAMGAAAALLALLAARWLSAGFSQPISELVGWTERIGGGEALPPETAGHRGSGAREFGALRTSLRTMATELDAAREREIHSARLTAWTEMARRVAHELKNPLTPMRMAATAMARREDEKDAVLGRVLLEEIARLDEMARTFSQFGRLPEGPISDIDVGELLRSLAQRQGVEPVPVEVECEPDLPLIQGHLDVLERAFRNLLVNAVEAAESVAVGGDGSATEPVLVLVDRTAGGVRVRVRDRGPGIREDLLESVWMPDVTTKRRGTGLGLAMVRQAVDAHGGTATARNRDAPLGGAEFEVVLPLGGKASWTS